MANAAAAGSGCDAPTGIEMNRHGGGSLAIARLGLKLLLSPVEKGVALAIKG